MTAARFSKSPVIDTDDVLQDALLGAVVRMSNTERPLLRDDDDTGIRYLRTSVVNRGMAMARREQDRPRTDLDLAFGGAANDLLADRGVPTENIVADLDAVERAIVYLQSKKPEFVDVFKAVIIHDESQVGYAARTGTPSGTVKSQLSRAKAVLLAAYETGKLAL